MTRRFFFFFAFQMALAGAAVLPDNSQLSELPAEKTVQEDEGQGELQPLEPSKPPHKKFLVLPAWLTKRNIAIASGIVLAALGLLALAKRPSEEVRLTTLIKKAAEVHASPLKKCTAIIKEYKKIIDPASEVSPQLKADALEGLKKVEKCKEDDLLREKNEYLDKLHLYNQGWLSQEPKKPEYMEIEEENYIRSLTHSVISSGDPAESKAPSWLEIPAQPAPQQPSPPVAPPPPSPLSSITLGSLFTYKPAAPRRNQAVDNYTNALERFLSGATAKVPAIPTSLENDEQQLKDIIFSAVEKGINRSQPLEEQYKTAISLLKKITYDSFNAAPAIKKRANKQIRETREKLDNLQKQLASAAKPDEAKRLEDEMFERNLMLFKLGKLTAPPLAPLSKFSPEKQQERLLIEEQIRQLKEKNAKFEALKLWETKLQDVNLEPYKTRASEAKEAVFAYELD